MFPDILFHPGRDHNFWYSFKKSVNMGFSFVFMNYLEQKLVNKRQGFNCSYSCLKRRLNVKIIKAIKK